MKISNIFRKNQYIPWITLSIILCCAVITAISIICPTTYSTLAWRNHPKYPWQYLTGAFLHGNQTGSAMAVAHLFANILMFAPYGVMIENMLGHKKFSIIIFASWLTVSAGFQMIVLLTVPAGENAYGAGLSGTAYTVITLGAYILFLLFRQNKRDFFHQILAYVFIGGAIGELFFLLPFVAGVASMLIHFTGILTGIILSFVYRKHIAKAIEQLK